MFEEYFDGSPAGRRSRYLGELPLKPFRPRLLVLPCRTSDQKSMEYFSRIRFRMCRMSRCHDCGRNCIR